MSKTALYVPPALINADEPFHNDLFSRENLAKRLTDCINRLPSGGVIAIDAPWGEGKSWFGQHWHNKLKADGYRTAFINAFERDYVEEPFVMLVSELLASLDASEKSKLKKSGIAVVRAITPFAVKSAINAVAQLATGTTNFSEKVDEQLEKAGDAIAAGAEKLLSKQIEDYEKSKIAVSGFRKTLGDLAATQEKPIIVFVDELDRCKPEFAVKLIERVKHFFEMPKVVFVLLLNRDQLCKAIKGVYGGEIDADRYLSKFIHLSLALPKLHDKPHTGLNANTIYCQLMIERFGLTHGRFAEYMGAWANLFGMSLRDIERAVGLLSLADVHSDIANWLAWPIALKITDPAVFSKILRNEAQAHQVCVERLESFDVVNSAGKFIDLRIDVWQKLHLASVNKLNEADAKDIDNLAAQYFRHLGIYSNQDAVRFLFVQVDMAAK